MLSIEIPLFLLFFSFMLAGKLNLINYVCERKQSLCYFPDPVFTNLLIYRTCYVTLGYNQSECALLGMKNATEKTAELEKLVQPYANIVSMTENIMDSLIISVVCTFFGPWSDKHGRRPLLLTCLLGKMHHD